MLNTNSKPTVLKKSKATVLEFYKGTAKVLKEHLLKSAVKNNQGTTLKMNARMFSANNLPHELLLTTRETTKLRNAIENNVSTDIKLPKAQISK